MKKLLVFLVSVIALTSCESSYDFDNGRSYEYGKRYDAGKSGIIFHEEDLLGTWSCIGIMFDKNEVKEFVVSRVGEANMLLQRRGTVSMFSRTYKYELNDNYITFQSKYPIEYGIMDGPYEFRIAEYMPGSLFLQDRNGIYEVKFYSAFSGY